MSSTNEISGLNDGIRQRVLGDGWAAWQRGIDFDGMDHYSRNIPITTGQGAALTPDAVERMFWQEFGIASAMVKKVDDRELNVTLFAGSVDTLKTYGWGEKDMGILAQVRMAKPAAPLNDPQAVLEEMVRLQVVEPKAWTESFSVARGHAKNAELFLPNHFIERLVDGMPGEHSQEFQLKEAMRNSFGRLLPGIPVSLYCTESEQGTLVRMSVKRENCVKLDNALMDAKQLPGTNVTDFQAARDRLLARQEALGKN